MIKLNDIGFRNISVSTETFFQEVLYKKVF